MADLAKSTTPPGNGVELMYTALTQYQVGWKEPYYSRNVGTLIFVRSGCGTYSVNDKLYTLKVGECFWLPYDTKIALLPIEGEPFHIQHFRFRIKDPVLYLKMRNVFPPVKVDRTLESLLTYLMENIADRDPYNRWRLESISHTVMSLFTIDQPSPGRKDSAFITTDGYCPATRRLLYYLENHLYKNDSVDKISRSLGYNRNYLTAVFSRDTGCIIREYINLHRVRTSIIFFFNWEVGVTETCEWLLFNSYSHFNRVFKRFVGIAPSSFYKACIGLSEDERSMLVKTEPILGYHIMPIDDLFAALLHLGQTMAEILERKRKNSSQMQTEERM